MSKDTIQSAPGPQLAGVAGSAVALLREILESDREAITETKTLCPWYQPDERTIGLHRRIERVLEDYAKANLPPNASGSANGGEVAR
jgi:hypothetical protein